MLDKLRQLIGRKSYPLNLITINKAALLSNYKYLSRINKKIKIAPVLKSNAYGHGIQIIGKIVDRVEAPFIAVDSLYEAFELQKAGVKTPISIMGYIDPQSLRIKKLPFHFAVYDLELASAINEYQKGAKVHVFVDTGMHREGVPMPDLSDFLISLIHLKNIEIVGLMSHLAIGSQSKNPLTISQLKEFKKAIEICKKLKIDLKYKHLGGTNAILHTNPDMCNTVRVGMGLYGLDPGSDDPSDMTPTLKVTTKIVQIKTIDIGDKVGYGATFTASKKMTIGILPFGYFDGLDRRLSNKGFVTINEIICKILGFASMNMTTIDLSGIENPHVGQEVVVFSDNEEDTNSFTNAAKLAGTTAYDLLVHLSPTTRRVVV